METGAVKVLDVALYRRGRLVTTLARWTALLLVLAGLAFAWDRAETRRTPAVAVAAVYALFSGITWAWQRRRARSPRLGAVQDVADALVVGGVAACSGGLANPAWLLLYPHAVALAARGGLRQALAFGSLDAAIVLFLAWLAPQPSVGLLHAAAILSCALVAGMAGSYLRSVQDRLSQANRDLASRNRHLAEALRAQDAVRREQDLALAQLREGEKRYRRLLERVQDALLIIQDGRLA